MAPMETAARRAALFSLCATCLTVAIKLAGAWASGSISVLAESLQSTMDIVMSGMVLWGLRVAAIPPDNDHPYGHHKAELLVSLLQMAIAMAVSGLIVFQAFPKLWAPPEIKADLGAGAMLAAVLVNLVSIAVVGRTAATTGSQALKGEFAHLWSDTLASAGVLLGVASVGIFRLPILDPLTAIVFTTLGAVLLVQRTREIIHPLMDGSLPEEDLVILAKALASHPDVRGYHKVLTRSTGRQRRITLHVLLEDSLTFVEAHELAEEIEEELSQALGGAEVTIHYEPHDAELEHRKIHHAEGTELPLPHAVDLDGKEKP